VTAKKPKWLEETISAIASVVQCFPPVIGWEVDFDEHEETWEVTIYPAPAKRGPDIIYPTASQVCLSDILFRIDEVLPDEILIEVYWDDQGITFAIQCENVDASILLMDQAPDDASPRSTLDVTDSSWTTIDPLEESSSQDEESVAGWKVNSPGGTA
jgi:hypothetical protein